MDMANLPYPKIGAPVKDYVLTEDIMVSHKGNAQKIPKGTKVKLKQDANFGYLVLPEPTTWGQKLFRY